MSFFGYSWCHLIFLGRFSRVWQVRRERENDQIKVQAGIYLLKPEEKRSGTFSHTRIHTHMRYHNRPNTLPYAYQASSKYHMPIRISICVSLGMASTYVALRISDQHGGQADHLPVRILGVVVGAICCPNTYALHEQPNFQKKKRGKIEYLTPENDFWRFYLEFGRQVTN